MASTLTTDAPTSRAARLTRAIGWTAGVNPLSVGSMFLGRARVRSDRARHLQLLLVLAAISVVTSLSAQADPTPQNVREQARDMFRTVIGFRTSVGLGHVPAMANYLADQFRKGGFPND